MRSVARIFDTAASNTEVTLVTRDRDLGASKPYLNLSGRWVRRGRSRLFYLDTSKVGQWLALTIKLRRREFDLLYVNSLWDPYLTILPIVAAWLGIIRTRRVLVAPRGGLSPEALSLKSRKKRLFLKVWAPLLRHLHVFWHASTCTEQEHILSVFPCARVHINANQFAVPEDDMLIPPAHDGPTGLVFISRIAVMKNLSLVLEALQRVSLPIQLDIYGPTEDARYWSRCQSLIGRMPPNVRVQYLGELAPRDVRSTFGRYDAFAFPTRGENFGHVIAESLSASCPVICSDATPWTGTLRKGGGAVVPNPTDVTLGVELERFAAMSPVERALAKHAAGAAYAVWRSEIAEGNVLDEVLRAPGAEPKRHSHRVLG